ncbi:MAG TPA: gamma-glutamyl-gamma-aminobutyrate hydrolase family protein [Burkholderiales bacterium]|nr:gamma-glutamyl-gamma-aminobutyrate hydrolase family protein [Burkholderiales bacterium]
MAVHVLQHTSAEYLGLIEDHLEGRNIRFHYVRPFTGKVPLPRPEAIDQGLVLLGGGPWGSAGARDVPTLAAEVALAKAVLAADKPVVGIGLGAQILSLAAGGGVEPAPLEFTVGAATRALDDALHGYLPATFPLVVYMRDRPLPPPGAQVLARDAGGRPALWQYGRAAFGFSGHPGMKVAMVEDLIMEFEEAPPSVEPALAQLRVMQRSIEDALVPVMTGLVQCARWMD